MGPSYGNGWQFVGNTMVYTIYKETKTGGEKRFRHTRESKLIYSCLRQNALR